MVSRMIKTMPKLKDGEAYKIPHEGRAEITILHKCCDCGLEHRMAIKKTPRNFILRFWRVKKGGAR